MGGFFGGDSATPAVAVLSQENYVNTAGAGIIWTFDTSTLTDAQQFSLQGVGYLRNQTGAPLDTSIAFGAYSAFGPMAIPSGTYYTVVLSAIGNLVGTNYFITGKIDLLRGNNFGANAYASFLIAVPGVSAVALGVPIVVTVTPDVGTYTESVNGGSAALLLQ